MNILVIFTGGTIGSLCENEKISPHRETKYILIETFKERFGEVCEFSYREPYFLLSENLDAKALNLLIGEVKEGLKGDFDGIIVTHGTDTLQFSAAALGFAAENAHIPVILVSSNRTLSDPKANGHHNFSAAVNYILKGGKGGVYISYKNPDGEAKIIEAKSVYTFLEDDDRLYSSAGTVEGEFSDFTLCEEPKILVIDPHPGDSYSYDLEDVMAVLFRPYHSGTLPTASPKLAAFCKKAKDKNIPMILCGGADGITYESSDKYSELGITPLPHSPFAATYMKLWIGISLGTELKKFMKE